MRIIPTEQSHEQSIKHARKFSSSHRSGSYLKYSSDFLLFVSRVQLFVSSILDGFEEIIHWSVLDRKFLICTVAFWKRLEFVVDMIKQKNNFKISRDIFSYYVDIHRISLHYIVKKPEEKIMKNTCILLINLSSNGHFFVLFWFWKRFFDWF